MALTYNLQTAAAPLESPNLLLEGRQHPGAGLRRGQERGDVLYVDPNSTIELSNFEGLVLGCIEAKFCK